MIVYSVVDFFVGQYMLKICVLIQGDIILVNALQIFHMLTCARDMYSNSKGGNSRIVPKWGIHRREIQLQ